MDGGGRTLTDGMTAFAKVVSAPADRNLAFAAADYVAARAFLVDSGAGTRWVKGLAGFAETSAFGDRHIVYRGDPAPCGLFSRDVIDRIHIVSGDITDRMALSIATLMAGDDDRMIAGCPPPARADFRFAVRTLDDIAWCCAVISTLFRLPVRTAIGFRELLVNAVEHGNLEITSDEKTALLGTGDWHDEVLRRLARPDLRGRFATLTANARDGILRLRIVDYGRGFDWHRIVGKEMQSSQSRHSRGIALAEISGFRRFDYIGAGNEVLVEIDLPA